MPSLADKLASSDLECRLCLEGQGEGPTFHLGLGTFRVPMALHEANRVKLAEMMPKGSCGVALLQGGDQQTRYDTDHEPVFRQESYFQYLFGVSEAGCFGAVSLPSARATLFVPELGEEYEVFCGRYPSPEAFKAAYGVEEVRHLRELPAWLEEQLGAEGTLYLLHGKNSDSGNYALPASFPGDDAFAARKDQKKLFEAAAEARVTKSAAEVEVLRYVNWVSSMAHAEVMRTATPGMMEYQLESLFQHHTYTHGGCRHQAYTCICACGPNPAILHYGHAGRPNSRQLGAGELALLDMGAEYHCYAADITCSFPVVDAANGSGGRFTAAQRLVYEAVLDAQRAVYKALRPGASWADLHELAEAAILRALLAGGVLSRAGHGSDEAAVDSMMAAGLGAVFMPHGLGHLIGLDTHDVGGYLPGTPERSTRPGLSKLRTSREVEAGMVLTVEPGCYFIDLLLDHALASTEQAPFLVPERIAALRGTGGVRLEDDVVVSAEPPYVENLSLCPRTVAEVESVIAGGAWPPERDEAPELFREWCRPNSAVQGGGMERAPLPS